MRRIFEHKLLVFIVIATLIAAVAIAVFSSCEDASPIEEAGVGVISPVQGAVSETGNFLDRIGNYFGSIKALRTENEKLKNENTNLQKQILDMRGLDEENKELRKMLKLVERETRIDMVAASVEAKDPTNWFSTLTINKGSDQGIRQNQPVVNSNRELVGQISRVGSNWAEVITILDPQSSVGAIIKRSKEIGIVEGNSSLKYEGKCRLGYIARDTDIKQGDFVETSGLGGIFPKGLKIGTITEVYDENATMSKAATLEPLANISKISEVFVITAYTENDLTEEEITEDRDAEANDDTDEEAEEEAEATEQDGEEE